MDSELQADIDSFASETAKGMNRPFDRIVDAARRVANLQTVVDEQVKDEGLWFVASTAPEAYLQQELRRLHAAIEEAPDGQ